MPGRQEPGLRLARTISRPSDREDGDAVREDHHPDDIRATIHTYGEVPRDEPTDITLTNAAKRLGVTRVAPSRVLNGSAAVRVDMICGCRRRWVRRPGLGKACRETFST
jgi:hypothetical protein